MNTMRCLVASAILALPIAAGHARPLDDVVASRVLRVAVYDDLYPFSFVEKGDPNGINVEIGRALAAQLGVSSELIVRMAGETVDDDLRVNIWKGPVTGGGVADVMLHVPVDRELALRNDLVFWGSSYFQESLAFALDTARSQGRTDLSLFRSERIAVEVDTVPDFFLLGALGGRVRPNVLHFARFQDAMKAFLAGDAVGVMGTRSQLEAAVGNRPSTAIATAPIPLPYQSIWKVGFAVRTDSRDLAYALNDAFAELRSSGELDRIFARYGVTFTPPPSP